MVAMSVKWYTNTGHLRLNVIVGAQNDGPGSAVRPMIFQKSGPWQEWDRIGTYRRPILRASEIMELEVPVEVIDVNAADQDPDSNFFRLVMRYEDVAANLYLLDARFRLDNMTLLLHEQSISRVAKANRPGPGASIVAEMDAPSEHII
jgi:hypothetical protein